VVYVALGDTIAEGVAASAGNGYAYRLRDDLARTRGRVDLLNFGQGGSTSSDLVAMLAGNREVRAALRSAHLITLSIGGNHLLGCGRDNFATVDGGLR
jgi:lysophospholipase L1-like esterase